MGKQKTVICGSYRKHLNEIFNLRAMLTGKGVSVLAPLGTCAINPNAPFVVLDSDVTNDPKTLQNTIFEHIRQSDFIVVGNKDGYIGRATAMEIGFALASGKRVYATENVTDPNLKPYVHSFAPLIKRLGG